jgi:hypothetical protein
MARVIVLVAATVAFLVDSAEASVVAVWEFFKLELSLTISFFLTLFLFRTSLCPSLPLSLSLCMYTHLKQLFVYHCVRACWYLDSVVWGMENATLANTLGSLLCFYVLYDLCYT